MILWEDGSQTYEPLSMIAADDPVTCALYGKKHGLLNEPGWKRFRSLAKKDKKMIRMINQAKLRSFRRTPFGYQVPRTPEEAITIDTKNGDTKWQDAMALEISQLKDCITFKDYGKGGTASAGYKKI